jgi:hypothetical protein
MKTTAPNRNENPDQNNPEIWVPRLPALYQSIRGSIYSYLTAQMMFRMLFNNIKLRVQNKLEKAKAILM